MKRKTKDDISCEEMQQILKQHIYELHENKIARFAKEHEWWAQAVHRALKAGEPVPGVIAECLGYEPYKQTRYRKIKK